MSLKQMMIESLRARRAFERIREHEFGSESSSLYGSGSIPPAGSGMRRAERRAA
jgi:hypothetical protein